MEGIAEFKKKAEESSKAELIARCEELNLATTGAKTQLLARIMGVGNIPSDVVTDDDDVFEEADLTQPITTGSKVPKLINNTPSVRTFDPFGGQPAPSLKFKDFEDTLEHFRGDEKQNIREWLCEFEQIAEMLTWGNLQKWLYARRLCKGTAWNFVVSNKHLKDWDSLKEALIDEFADAINTTHVHDQLRLRKKKSNESVRDYFISVTGLAKTINLEDAAVIEYVIRGIDDDERNKAVLYSAKNLNE